LKKKFNNLKNGQISVSTITKLLNNARWQRLTESAFDLCMGQGTTM